MTEEKRLSNAATTTVKTAAKEAGVSPTAMYEACARGEVPSIKIGRRVLVLRGPFDKMLGKDEAVA